MAKRATMSGPAASGGVAKVTRRCCASRRVGVLITALGWRIGTRYSFQPTPPRVATPFRTKTCAGREIHDVAEDVLVRCR